MFGCTLKWVALLVQHSFLQSVLGYFHHWKPCINANWYWNILNIRATASFWRSLGIIIFTWLLNVFSFVTLLRQEKTVSSYPSLPAVFQMIVYCYLSTTHAFLLFLIYKEIVSVLLFGSVADNNVIFEGALQLDHDNCHIFNLVYQCYPPNPLSPSLPKHVTYFRKCKALFFLSCFMWLLNYFLFLLFPPAWVSHCTL